MSKSFDQPLVTPSMAFETSARVSPWIAACESFSRDATTNPSFVSSLIPEGIGCSTLPFGPSTTIRLPCTVYFTPVGNGIGFFPIRDILSILHGLRVPESFKAHVPLQPMALATQFLNLRGFGARRARPAVRAALTRLRR